MTKYNREVNERMKARERNFQTIAVTCRVRRLIFEKHEQRIIKHRGTFTICFIPDDVEYVGLVSMS